MCGLKPLVMAGGLLVGFSGAALAADLLPPPPPLAPPPAPIEVSGWYLRGDIGFSNQDADKLDNALYGNGLVQNLNKGFDSAPFIGIGAGYKFSNWIRADLTTEYRGKSSFTGLDRYADSTLFTGWGTDSYTATKSEWTTLANIYVDLGTWNGITPFVGAGIGGSYNTISDFTDTNVVTAALAYGREHSQWQFAWALYAGLAYQVTPNFSVELAYRYLDLGDAQSGDLIGYNGANSTYNPMKFKDLTSQDIKIGLRWMLGPTTASAEPYPPLVRSY